MQSERSVGIGELLRVESVTRQHGGLYVCTADNGAGSKSRDFVVDVLCTLQRSATAAGSQLSIGPFCVTRSSPTHRLTYPTQYN